MRSMRKYRLIIEGLRRFKWFIGLCVLLMSAGMLASLLAIWLQQSIIDRVFIGGEWEVFGELVIQLGLAYLLHVILVMFGPYNDFKLVTYARGWLSERMMEHVLRTPISAFQKERTAAYVYRLTHDREVTAYLFGSYIPHLAQQLVGLAVLFGTIGAISPFLLLLVGVVAVLYILFSKIVGSSRREISAEVNAKRSELLVHLEEGVSATREVLAFRREKWEDARYRSLFQAYFHSAMKEAKLLNKQVLLSDPLKFGAVMAVLFYGGWLVLQGRLSIGYYVVLFQFVSRLMETAQAFYIRLMDFSGSLASADRLQAVLEGEEIAEGTIKLPGKVESLRLSEVTFRYEGTETDVLSGVNLDFPIGRKIALVGSSGGGKSTIASLLIRFNDPTEGAVSVNGRKLTDIERDDWARKLTIVFQEPYFFPDTIRMNLTFGMDGVDDRQIRTLCEAMQIDKFIDSLPKGLDTELGERGITLSGGQRQRLSLVRALLRESEILLLDEATSSLDLETERQIQRKLDELRKGRTTIIIAHRLSTVMNADVIYVMDQGKVSAYGTHPELMERSAVYRSLVLKETGEENELAV